MAYQPFLIADFASGLLTAKQPWLLPQDAFSSLTNLYVQDGVLKKRLGYTEFGTKFSTDAILGIFRHIDQTSGTEKILAANLDYLLELTGGAWAKVAHNTLVAAAVWTGDEDNLIHTVQYGDTLYMANDKDKCQSYDGTTFDHFYPLISGVTYVESGAFLATMKRRLIIFKTTEGATYFPQRARWSSATDQSDFTGDDCVDAPTGEHIQGIAQLGEDIIVYFDRSVWRFIYTGDATLPFRWERVSTDAGCRAPYTAIAHKGLAYAMGKAGLVATDGMQVERIDKNNPDVGLKIDPTNFNRCVSAIVEESRQIWIAYPSPGESTPDKILVMDFETGAWSTFDQAFTCFGFSETISSATWATLGGTWGSQTVSWGDASLQSGYPIILAGDASGNIWRVNSGLADDGDAIAMSAMSAKWNPFQKQGLSARMGWIDFFVTANAATEMTVSVLIDDMTTATISKTISFDMDAAKGWVSMPVNVAGRNFRLYLSQSAASQPVAIHAIRPWFMPTGRMRGE